MRTPRKNTVLATILMALFLLSGCGQKGPLYLPEPDEQEQAQ